MPMTEKCGCGGHGHGHGHQGHGRGHGKGHGHGGGGCQCGGQGKRRGQHTENTPANAPRDMSDGREQLGLRGA